MIAGSLMAASLLALPSGQIAMFTALLGTGISIRGMAQAPNFESAIEGALVDAAVTMAGGLGLKGVARLAHMTPAQKLFEAMKNGMLKPVEKMIGKITNSAGKSGLGGDALGKALKTGTEVTGNHQSAFGRAFAKHTNRSPQHQALWGKLSGSNQKINEVGLKHFNDILNGPGKFTPDRWKGMNTLVKRIPDGRGVRIKSDGTFIGYLDPPL